MCELFAMSARFPTTIHLSLDELARHGGATGPHRDGWGLAFMQDRDALLLREAEAASESALLTFLQGHDVESDMVIAHLRRATQGLKTLANTQPFVRELGGRAHVFAHNGMFPGIEADARFTSARFRRLGDTDSEQAFCALLDRLAALWERGVPSVEERLAVLVPFAAALGTLGSANFLYADTDALFAHGHRRIGADGVPRPPGLHWLCRRCEPDADRAPIAGVRIAHGVEQEVALVATVPLSAEAWTPLAEGELLVIRHGQVIARRAPAGPVARDRQPIA